eukprot:3940124-Rhodomonas_salina.1
MPTRKPGIRSPIDSELKNEIRRDRVTVAASPVHFKSFVASVGIPTQVCHDLAVVLLVVGLGTWDSSFP